MTPSVAALIDGRALRDWWTLLYVPGDVFHVQARSGGRVWAGTYHYNDLDTVIEHLDALIRTAPELAVSATVNPVTAEGLAQGPLTEVADPVLVPEVRERRWLPVVVEGTGAAALELATRMASTLGAEGWASPVIVQSPEAAVLLYRVRLRNTQDDQAVVVRAYDTLTARFLAEDARLSPAGTMPDLQVGVPGAGAVTQRWRVVRAPSRLDVVTREQLQAGRAPVVESASGWEADAFETGLEHLERVFADSVPSRLVSADPLELGTRGFFDEPPTGSPALHPRPTELMALRATPRPAVPHLPETDFEEALERYRLQHQQKSVRLSTSFTTVDQAIGGLQGLVVLDGDAGDGRLVLALQMAVAALFGEEGTGTGVVIVSLDLHRQAIMDRLVSHVSGVPSDVLNHGHARQKVHGQDGLRLDSRERRAVKDAVARLAAVQSRLCVVDGEWVSRRTSAVRPREWLAGLLAEAKRSVGASRCLCVLDDLRGWTELTAGLDAVAELQRVSTAHPEDALLVVAVSEDTAPLRTVGHTRLSLTRLVDAVSVEPGVDAMRLTASTRRTGVPDVEVALRYRAAIHRFDTAE